MCLPAPYSLYRCANATDITREDATRWLGILAEGNRETIYENFRRIHKQARDFITPGYTNIAE